jgi:peptidyl-prolyl cis-trans isomerase SurA
MEIVAVANGDAITNADVTARGKLFAISTGIPITPELLDRLRPQITQQLIDERLRLQEVLRRHVIVDERKIAAAIREIEQRNNMPPDALRTRLAADGVNLRTLVDQIRVQIGWTEVLRQHLGTSSVISEAEISEQARLTAQQVGKPEYRLGEIFIAVDNPARTADAQRFADAVIGQLRSGAPFPVVAAQFSQSQTALQGGDLGWLAINQLDPEIAAIAPEMPTGAISNPIKVAGGFAIVQMRGKREIGREAGVVVTLRQVFLPFSSALNPEAPTEQQRATLEKARQIGTSVRSCQQMEQAHTANNSPRPADPGGEVNLATVSPPQFRQLLATLPVERASQPLISGDGVTVVIVCSREHKVLAQLPKEEIQTRLLSERVELASRQLQRDLRRRATIDVRGGQV